MNQSWCMSLCRILIQWKVVIIIFGGWEEAECMHVCEGEGLGNFLELQLPQQEVSTLGYECDSKGHHYRRWGLLPQIRETWVDKDKEQRNAIFCLEPSGKI